MKKVMEIQAKTCKKGVRNVLLEESVPKSEKRSKSVPKCGLDMFPFWGHFRLGVRKSTHSKKVGFSESAPEQLFMISSAFGACFGDPF